MRLLARQIIISAICGCLLLLGACRNPEASQQGGRRAYGLRIGHIRDMGDYLQSCGCAFQRPEDTGFNSLRCVLLVGTNNNALMNINDRDIRLQSVSHARPEGRLMNGDRYYGVYADETTQAEVEYVVVDTCSRVGRECRLADVNAIIKVTRSNQVRRINARGVCGCP